MTMKRRYKTKAEIPADYVGLYEEQDGWWVAKIDISEDIETLTRSLENAKRERGEAKDGLKKFEGVDLELYAKLVDEHKKKEDKKLIDAGKVDELVEQRVAEMRKGFEKQIAELTQQNEALNGRLSTELIDNQILLHSKGAGIRDTATEDLLLRGRGLFKLNEGKVVALDKDGKTLFGKEGKELTILDWLKGPLLESAPHLYNNPSGGNTPSGAGQGGSGGVQGFRISRADARDPQKYQQAKTEAEKAGTSVQIVD